MKPISQVLLRASVVAAAAAALTVGGARAQEYPSQDIHLICGFPAGSGADVIVRYMAEKMRPLAGRTVVVENKPGAAGNIAVEYVARSKPDGHTMYIGGGSGVAGNMNIFKKPPVDVPTQLFAAATLHRQAFMLVVDAKKPWKTVAELTAYLKERGDKSTYGTSAAAGQVMGEMYKAKTGVQSVQVVYKTGQDSLNDMLAGNIDFGTVDPQFGTSQHKAGRLRVLGVSTPTRLESTPDFPTMKESGVDMEFTAWWAAIVPAATPRPAVEKINKWVKEIMSTAESKAFFNAGGGDPWITTPDEANAFLIKSVKDWAEYVRIAKIPQM
jgi:tripartite-type tricarboxylate transporter receptor subunit TctC